MSEIKPKRLQDLAPPLAADGEPELRRSLLSLTVPEAARDKTAVNLNFASPKKLWWENPQPRYLGEPEPEKPFVSELKKEAIKRQAEQQPQSGHVEPQFFPAMGVMKGIGQTGGLIKKDIKEMLKR
jgi:hypothetical protein